MIRRASFPYFAFLLLALSVMTACSSSMPPESRAIAATSERVRAALVATYQSVYSQPQPIRMRYNPCACDENLLFDAHLFGEWQRVSLTGSPEVLQNLINSAQALPPGTPFDVPVVLRTTSSYGSDTNQQFYSFEYYEAK